MIALCASDCVPSYVAKARELFVRVDDDALKTVGFIGVEANGRFTPVGSAFFAGQTIDDLDFFFVITAAHNIDLIAGDSVWLRVNMVNGGSQTWQFPKSLGWAPVDPGLDLIAFPVPGLGLVAVDQKALILERAHWAERRTALWEPGVGDEVVTIGLYGSHYGLLKNVPVVRIGHIAMMPGEPVMTNSGYVRAYLVEVKLIAGLSGSMVYLKPPPTRVNAKGELEHLSDTGGGLIPIGMMLGYHIVQSAQDQIAVPLIQGEERGEPSIDERNTRFAVVLPFECVLDLFEQEDSQEAMKRAARTHVAASGFRPAGLRPVQAEAPTEQAAVSADNPNHQEDFKRLLSAAAKAKPRAG